MHFTSFLAAACAVATAAGNKVTFLNQDSVPRTIVATPSAGQAELASVPLPPHGTVDVDCPEGWIGNFRAIREGATDTGNGMLAEVAFNGFNAHTYYDVSAIVDDKDLDNIKMMTPFQGEGPVSGCQDLRQDACDKVYRLPDDIQTQSTAEDHILVYVGNLVNTISQKRALRRGPVQRSYVLGGAENNA